MACTKQYFASNGKESLLFNSLAQTYGENRAEEIYLKIHTPEFKQWYGDWEAGTNLKEDGRPLEGFDTNGEPLVLWHGLAQERHEGRNPQIYSFTSDYNEANDYATKGELLEKGNRSIYPVFLKMDDDISVLGFEGGTSYTVPRFLSSNIKSIFNEGPFSSLSTNIYKSKVAPEEVASNLQDSSSKIGAPSGTTPGSGYVIGGKEIPRVSHMIDSVNGLKYRGEEAGEVYSEAGTRYHAFAEDIIKGVSNAEIDSKYKVEPYERGYLNSMRTFIENLQRQGGTILSEFKVASMDANDGKGVAGTIDILHIQKDGSAVVYDIKSANETEWKRSKSHEEGGKDPWDISDFEYYKARRYSHQTQLYASTLEKSDETTGRRAIRIKDVFVIPVEIYRNSDNSIRQVEMRRAENIKSWKVGRKQFAREARRWADEIISGKKRKAKISGLEYASTVDTWLPTALGIDLQARNMDRSALRFVENRGGENKKFMFNNKWHTWVSENKDERIQQAKALIESSAEGENDRIANSIEVFFNGETTGIFRSPDSEGDGGVTSAAGQRLSKVIASANAVDIKRLNTVDGFQKYDDIVLLERPDGSYDMLKMTYEPLGRRFDIANPEKNVLRNFTNTESSTATNSILGNYLTPIQARELKVSMQNTMGDYHRMRLGLIAMELTSANPSMKINRLIVDQLSNGSQDAPYAMPAFQAVEQIKKLASLEPVKALAQGGIKTLLEDNESYAMAKYTSDPVTELMEYMSTQLTDSDFESRGKKENARGKIQYLLTRYKNDELAKDDLVAELINGVNGLRELIREKYGAKPDTENLVSSDPEFILLSRVILDLKGVTLSPEKDITKEFFGFISKFIKSPSYTGRQTADKAYDYFRQYYDDIKHEVQGFIHEASPYTNELVRESPIYKRGLGINNANVGGTDTIFAMGQSVFEKLIQRKTDATGKTYTVPFLIGEGSAEFQKLTPAERKYIKYFNDTIQKYFPTWQRGMIPLQLVSPNTLLYRGKKDFASMRVDKAAREGKDALVASMKLMRSRGNETVDETPGSDIMDSTNDFYRGLVAKGTGEYHVDTLQKYGMDENYNLTDAKANEGFETNLEVILSRFATHYIKKKHMDKALPVYHVMRSILKLYELSYGLDQTDTIQSLDFYMKDIVFNKKQSEEKVISDVINFGVRSSSIALLGFNPKAIISNTTQMFTGGIIDSVTNSMTNDPRFPGIKNFSRAGLMMLKAVNPAEDGKQAALFNLLKEAYLPDDVGVVTGTKNQKTASGLVNTQTAFAIDRMTEYTIRTQHLVAQMLKDGSFEAHDVVQEKGPDGYYRWTLKYDPKKDKRFDGEEGKILYDTLKEQMEEKGELTDDGEIKYAYDWRLRSRMGAYINLQIGSFDRDLGSHWNRFSMMYSMSQFRSWFRDKYQRATKLEYQSDMLGNYVRNGEGMVWEKETMKGILWTLADLPSIAGKVLKKEKIAAADIRNLVYSANSLAALGMMMAIVASAWDDDDEVPSFMQGQITRFYSDVLSFVSLSPFLSITVNPITFVSYYQRLFNAVGRSATYGMQGENEKAMQALKRITPIINNFPVND